MAGRAVKCLDLDGFTDAGITVHFHFAADEDPYNTVMNQLQAAYAQLMAVHACGFLACFQDGAGTPGAGEVTVGCEDGV